MPAADWTALLTAEGSVLTEPEQVEKALSHLWRATLKPHREGDELVASRVCAANLIILGLTEQWNAISATLGELSPAYPTRTIVLLLDPGDNEHNAAKVNASVTALCHVGQAGDPQVCCEQIVLRTGITDAARIQHTLLPLLESEVPSVVWWACDPLAAEDLFKRLQTTATSMVIDAGLSGLPHLTPQDGCALRELGWYRTARWRELVAGLWDGCDLTGGCRVEQLSITCTADETARVDALWLMAFVGGQLNWQPLRKLHANGWAFTAQGKDVHAVLVEQSGPASALMEFALSAGESRWLIQRCATGVEEYRTIVHHHDVCELPRGVQLRTRSRASSLLAAFTSRNPDRVFQRAAPLAQWLAK